MNLSFQQHVTDEELPFLIEHFAPATEYMVVPD